MKDKLAREAIDKIFTKLKDKEDDISFLMNQNRLLQKDFKSLVKELNYEFKDFPEVPAIPSRRELVKVKK